MNPAKHPLRRRALLLILPVGMLTALGWLLLQAMGALRTSPDPLPVAAAPAQARDAATAWRLTVRGQLQATLARNGDHLLIDVKTPFPDEPYIQCLRHGVPFRSGETYTLHFRARSNDPRRILAGVQWDPLLRSPDQEGASDSMEEVELDWRTYAVTFRAERDYGTAAFTIGRLPGEVEISDVDIRSGRPDPIQGIGWSVDDHPAQALLLALVCFGPILLCWRGVTPAATVTALLCMAVVILSIDYLSWRVLTLRGAAPWLSLPLFAAELLSIFQALGFQYTVWPRKAPRAEITRDMDGLPVFVLIPTVDEGSDVLEPTIQGALAMRARYLAEHPTATVTIAVCNDGRAAGIAAWRDVEELAEQLGVRCCTREAPGGAKAGNIEHARQALGATGEALIAIFDADQIPRPEFLVRTAPLFGDPHIGWVQTPQCYRNRENRLARWADEQQSVFYDVICPAKAGLDSTAICGTNVVIRAAALDSIGGLPQDSVTEDAAASILLHGHWRSVYLSEPLADGLGPLDLAGFFSQQRRWSAGMLRILVRQGFGALCLGRSGLRPAQRIQYLLSCSHFLCGLRDAVAFVIPCLFLLLGGRGPAYGIDVRGLLSHFLPFWALSWLAYHAATRGCRNDKLGIRSATLRFGSFPIYLVGLGEALSGGKVRFRITPKRASGPRRGPGFAMLPQVCAFALGVSALVHGAMTQRADAGPVDATPLLLNGIWVSCGVVLLGALLCVSLAEAFTAAGAGSAVRAAACLDATSRSAVGAGEAQRP